jgi:hypothetical protein
MPQRQIAIPVQTFIAKYVAIQFEQACESLCAHVKVQLREGKKGTKQILLLKGELA